jgi:peptidoglycan hydrolase CwlO-like protein
MLGESKASTLSALSLSLQSLVREKEEAQKHAQDLQSQIDAGMNEIQTINLRLQEQDTGRAMMARNLMELKNKLATAPQSILAEQVKYNSQLSDLKGKLEAYQEHVLVKVED